MTRLRIIGVTGMDQLMRSTARLSSLAKREVTAYIGTNLVDPPYPFFLEFGTSRMPAYPAARPAFHTMEGPATEAGRRALQALITSGFYSAGALPAVVHAMALPIENEWKRLARIKTGTYRRSIHTEVE